MYIYVYLCIYIYTGRAIGAANSLLIWTAVSRSRLGLDFDIFNSITLWLSVSVVPFNHPSFSLAPRPKVYLGVTGLRCI